MAYGLLRFGAGLRGFLREEISVPAARRLVEQRLAQRPALFGNLIERAIFGHPRSPYRQLFRAAGCELGDVLALVQAEGVEGALRHLRQQGVYVSFEEFKGRAVASRGSQRFEFRDTDFDNPLISSHYQISSGGTRGRPTRILIDLEYLAERAPHWSLWFAAQRLHQSQLVFVTPYYPGIVNRMLICARAGQRFVRWYCTGRAGDPSYRLVTAYVHAAARWLGGLPAPTFFSLTESDRIAAELAALAASRPVAAITSPSTAVRLSAAAQEHGLRLSRVSFLLGGEPQTAARQASIEASGARAIPNYGFSEAGTVGSQCPSPLAPDEIHVGQDSFAVIQHPRSLPDGDEVGALLLTTLLPSSPKLMLNAEIGDYGTLETRRCDCLFDELGLHQRLHGIRSFEKLTGEGVTFAGSDLFVLLEQVLPARFGGGPADYQLVEQQDPRGLPRYELRISPEVGPLDESAVVSLLLAELGRRKRHYRFMAEQWAQTGALTVRRERPLPSPMGKIMPFRTLTSA